MSLGEVHYCQWPYCREAASDNIRWDIDGAWLHVCPRHLEMGRLNGPPLSPNPRRSVIIDRIHIEVDQLILYPYTDPHEVRGRIVA